MKQVSISVNGKVPFTTKSKVDLENLFDQMGHISNNFHCRPDVFFTVERFGKTVKVNWQYFDAVANNAHQNGIAYLDKMVDILLADLELEPTLN